MYLASRGDQCTKKTMTTSAVKQINKTRGLSPTTHGEEAMPLKKFVNRVMALKTNGVKENNLDFAYKTVITSHHCIMCALKKSVIIILLKQLTHLCVYEIVVISTIL
jgi:hypothetical protein